MMKKLLIFPVACTLVLAAPAQKGDGFVYAITDQQPNGVSWNFLRKLDLQTGAYSGVLLEGNDTRVVAYDATSRKPVATPMSDTRVGLWANAPFGTGVAAMAYDRRNDRLYYTPMFIDQLRYIDLKTMKVYYVTELAFTGKPEKTSDQGNIVTRMVIASDGNGYAMTNDATQLIRFTTGKRTAITDLGTLVDDPANEGVSIHNSCSSYGGDMIADDKGRLIVFSARNQVYRIDLESKVATRLGAIKGLPQGFTVNGAAVTAENRILVASAVMGGGYYMIDMNSLNATPYAMNGTSWQSSDLANGNLYVTGEKTDNPTVELLRAKPQPMEENSRVSIYPNPVSQNQFMIQFTSLDPGSYTITLTDIMGRRIYQQPVILNGSLQQQVVKLDPSAARGVYLVNVLDGNNKTAYSTKIVVQ
ncbi:MAG: hypothetical protein RJA57_223 [Bacteroidota bacterium]|jgi:hypothetical protein